MIKLLSLFSGIGAFEKALSNLHVDYELVNYCEIDPYASKAYSMIHKVSEDLNLRDVTTIDTSKLHDIDLMTWGFPCTDISVAGKQKGFEDSEGNRTRSGLFFEGLRILQDVQPKYSIVENVKALTSKKFEKEFNTVLSSLSEVGYNNYWKVLNAKDFGIPQNRERVFIISIRKDIDTGCFTFPEKQELQLRVKDMLEPVVDEKYYIDNERSRNLIQKIKITEPIICRSTGRDPDNPSNRAKGCNTEQTLEPKKDGCSNTLTTVQKDNLVIEPLKIKRLGNLYDENAGGARAGNVYAPNGLAPALQTAQGGNRQPLIFTNKPVVWSKNKQVDMNSYINEIISKNIETPVAIDEQNVKVRTDGLVGTIMTDGSSPKKNNRICCTDFRIRKLTPRECFRLMGFTDADFDKIKGISNTQLYKMAGNSIVVNVLEAIFKQLFKENHKE